MMSKERFIHYTLGVVKMDRSHWEMFMLLNTVIKILTDGKYEEAAFDIDKLSSSLKEHDAMEERLMDECSFPYKKYYLDESIDISLKKLKHDAVNGQCSLYAILKFENIFVDHVDHKGRQLAEYILRLNNE